MQQHTTTSPVLTGSKEEAKSKEQRAKKRKNEKKKSKRERETECNTNKTARNVCARKGEYLFFFASFACCDLSGEPKRDSGNAITKQWSKIDGDTKEKRCADSRTRVNTATKKPRRNKE